MGHDFSWVALLPVATPKTSTDAEHTDAAKKQLHIRLFKVVPLSNELPSASYKDALNMKLKVFG